MLGRKTLAIALSLAVAFAPIPSLAQTASPAPRQAASGDSVTGEEMAAGGGLPLGQTIFLSVVALAMLSVGVTLAVQADDNDRPVSP